jgi:hypothetical protein
MPQNLGLRCEAKDLSANQKVLDEKVSVSVRAVNLVRSFIAKM